MDEIWRKKRISFVADVVLAFREEIIQAGRLIKTIDVLRSTRRSKGDEGTGAATNGQNRAVGRKGNAVCLQETIRKTKMTDPEYAENLRTESASP